MLSDLLGKIPFKLQITSGYRDPEANKRVGGASSSQHVKAQAADIKAYYTVGDRRVYFPNFALGTWLWLHQNKFPNLDQVITYTDKGHLHVSVSERPRKKFGITTRGQYRNWQPNPLDLPMRMTGVDPRVLRSWLPQVVITLGIGAVGLALVWRYQDQIRERLSL
jgi:hypothetical protein